MLVGCSFRSQQDRCVFPDDPTVDAPMWVCQPNLADYHTTLLLSTGEHPNQFELQQHLLLQQANQELVAHFQNRWFQWLSPQMQLNEKQRQRLFRSLAIPELFFQEARIVRNRTSSKGALFVIVALSRDSVDFLKTEAFKQSALTNAQMWKALLRGQRVEAWLAEVN